MKLLSILVKLYATLRGGLLPNTFLQTIPSVSNVLIEDLGHLEQDWQSCTVELGREAITSKAKVHGQKLLETLIALG